MLDKVLNIFGMIVVVGGVATALSPRSQTAKVLDSFADLFIGALKAAKDQDG